MSAAPETKYTDRDVRENEELADRAIDYVEAYTGDFEYLIDMKMRVGQGYQLTTPMIRGILNCMRHDPRITDLPVPLPPDDSVIEMNRYRKRSPGKTIEDYQCSNLEPHYCHSTSIGWCEGVEWPINRERYYRDALIKAPYAMARSMTLLHKTTGEGWMQWFPEHHGPGFYAEPELVVDLACLYPSQLRKPYLFFEIPSIVEFTLKNCPRCFDGE